MIKFLPLTITVFFLFSFLTSNGQVNNAPGVVATNPAVTINQASLQPDPVNVQPINFSVVFDQPVGGFTSGDVNLSGTAGATTVLITGGPIIYNVAVSGMIYCGTVTASIPAGVCVNALSEPNLASTSIDNTVTYAPLLPNPNVTINQAASQPDPTSASPINFTVLFDQPVTGFTTGDVTLSGTAGATTGIVTGSGYTYNVAVSGMTASGTVIATIPAGVAQSSCSPSNNASTSTDNTVTITCVLPIVNVTPAVSCGGVAGGGSPCNPLTASGNADVYIWSPLAGLFTNCTMTTPYTGTNLPTVYAGPTINTIYTVTGTISATGCNSKATAQVNYTPPAPVVTPASVNMCLGAPAVRIYVTSGGIPTTLAVWSPIAGLFNDAASTIPYTGDRRDTLWTRPTPAGVYTYQVTTQGLPSPLCTPATNFVSTNGNATVTFNVKNNHPYPIVLSHIDSKTLTAGLTSVRAYYKTTGIFGNPGAINAANGWIQFASAGITGTGTSVQRFLSNLSLTIPPGSTFGICIEAITGINTPNLSYSALTPGTQHSFNDGECEIITGSNIGYSGAIAPAAPTVTPSGFIGAVHFSQITTPCTSPPRTVVVTVGQIPMITQPPTNQNICIGASASFSVTVAGAGPFTYQWQVSINGGAIYNNLVNAAPYGGVNTNTLSISTPPINMSGYLYRVLVSGGPVCSNATSSSAMLTVNPLPGVTITANPLIIGPTQTTTIISTVTPNPAATYTWYYNNTVLPGAVSSSLLVSYGSPGDYQLRVTDINGCTGFSNILTIANSFTLNMLSYPNPSGGIFQVIYLHDPNGATNNTLLRSLTVYNNWGAEIFTRVFPQTTNYQKIDVDIRQYGKGLYWVELTDANGKRLGMNRVVVQ